MNMMGVVGLFYTTKTATCEEDIIIILYIIVYSTHLWTGHKEYFNVLWHQDV